MPRSVQQGRIGSHGPKSSLDSESVKGAGIQRAMETSDPVRPCGDKIPANKHISIGAHSDGTSDPALPADPAVLDALASGPMSAYELASALGPHASDAASRAYALVTQARVVWIRDELKYALPTSSVEPGRTPPDGDNPHDAALDILRDVGYAVNQDSWRYECEDRGYHFEPDEFREIVEDLLADKRVRVIYEDPAWAEERYMEDPDAWADEWPENPPVYETVDN